MGRLYLFLEVKQVFVYGLALAFFYFNQKPGIMIAGDEKINFPLIFIPQEIQSILTKSIICPQMDSFK